MTKVEPETPPLPLKIAALDPQDLAILSAHLQDAEVKVGDMAYLPGQKRFALVGDRFDWIGAGRGRCERCLTGLHFERVSRVRRAGFDQDPDAVLTLLAISFMPDNAPAGTVMLHFSNDGAVRLDVECVEAALSDIGPRRSCGNPPQREGRMAAAASVEEARRLLAASPSFRSKLLRKRNNNHGETAVASTPAGLSPRVPRPSRRPRDAELPPAWARAVRGRSGPLIARCP